MNISDEIKAVRFFNNLHEKQLSLKKQKGKVLNYTANLCRHYYKSEALIKKALKKPSKLHYEVIGMIRLGCYLIEEDPQNTPKIIHHMVECIKPHHKWATSIVNGTLRNIVRNKDQWSQDMALSDKYNVPSWLFEKIAHHYPLHFEDIFNQW
ncbi:MAG TPA: transcription antitermination factor NusB, partial [Gammaproteobacteria bacterium]|nr:transcription antitermination factor NusB [Gammaproteobacteria bacterium]